MMVRKNSRTLLALSFGVALIIAGLGHAAAPAAAAVEERPGVPNDPRWSQQWNLAANPGVGIDVREAWRYGCGKGTVLAVVDSGIIAHPEFEGRILPGYDFISNSRIANDGDGRDPDPTDPGDWVSKEDVESGSFDEDCKESPSDWHGTHVAGIALAAADNGVGIAGIAPLAELLPVRVMGKCGGTDRDLIDGMRWAAGLEVSGAPVNENPADVINLSLGGEGSCSGSLQSAVDEITALGVMIVASVGNEAKDASLYSPANCFGPATVGALTASGTLATYSNFGNFVDVGAPGGDTGAQIISTVDRGSTTAVAEFRIDPTGIARATLIRSSCTSTFSRCTVVERRAVDIDASGFVSVTWIPSRGTWSWQLQLADTNDHEAATSPRARFRVR